MDDGSRNNTKDVVKGYLAENNTFEIRYHYQENQDKHIATNWAVQLAGGHLHYPGQRGRLQAPDPGAIAGSSEHHPARTLIRLQRHLPQILPFGRSSRQISGAAGVTKQGWLLCLLSNIA